MSTRSKRARAVSRSSSTRCHAASSSKTERRFTGAFTEPASTYIAPASRACTSWPRRAASRIIAIDESL